MKSFCLRTQVINDLPEMTLCGRVVGGIGGFVRAEKGEKVAVNKVWCRKRVWGFFLFLNKEEGGGGERRGGEEEEEEICVSFLC